MDEPYMVEVDSVGAFISEITELKEKYNWPMAYFRGESRDFRASRLTASALRRTDKKYTQRMGQYRDMLFARLTPNESEHFLAFCQHHGFPTNLLDVTMNPLVALYFACNENPKRDGVVYGFDEKFCDFTRMLNQFGTEDILVHFLITDGNRQIRAAFVDELEPYIGRSEDIECSRFYRVLGLGRRILFEYEDGTSEWVDTTVNSFMKAGIEEAKKAADERIRFRLERLPENEDGSPVSFAHKRSETVVDYIHGKMSCVYHGNGGFWFQHLLDDVLPPSIYKPLLDFGRARAQHSCFVYQWHWGSLKQRVAPDCVFKIPADKKESILRTLDTLAVNRATIFGDYDSISQYVQGAL